MNKYLNFTYAAIQGFYWMYFAVIISFASIFLLDRGYSNSQIGFILAFANILAVVIQPIFGDIVDRSKKLSIVSVISIMATALIIGTGSLYFMDNMSLILTGVFIITAALQISLQPLINSIAFYYSRAGNYINFGATRSVGSVAYAIVSSILGFLVLRFGTRTIPLMGIVVLLLLLTFLILTDKLFKKDLTFHTSNQSTTENLDDNAQINLIQFIKKNKIFVILTLGIMLVFFQNAVINNFLIQILRNIGGNSSQMGKLFSFMALLEIPGLFFFSKIRMRISCQTMLKLSSVAFILKVFLTYLAPSVGFIYLAFLFQLISFPLFLSSAVHLTDEVMEKGEAVKGQSLVIGMMTLSGVFASLLGGALLDLAGPSQLLLISTLFAMLGTVFIFVTVNKV